MSDNRISMDDITVKKDGDLAVVDISGGAFQARAIRVGSMSKIKINGKLRSRRTLRLLLKEVINCTHFCFK